MWRSIGKFILNNRILLLILMVALTAFMGWQASKVTINYKFGSALPSTNQKFKDFTKFKEQFGEDGNSMFIAVQTDKFFNQDFFEDYTQLITDLQKIEGVEFVMGVPNAFNLVKDTLTEKLTVQKLVNPEEAKDARLVQEKFENLPFYRGMLVNQDSKSYLIMAGINKDLMLKKERTIMMEAITDKVSAFGKKHDVDMKYSGLPFIRVETAKLVQGEMNTFLIVSLVLSACILFYFFRSFSGVGASMLILLISVVWALGIMQLLGYKINLLTAMIPPLVVVISIPNCVYFLNKYQTHFAATGDKKESILEMVDRMSIITLFTNITAAIGFVVFYFTESEMLGEFGLLAAMSIMAIFFISLILLPILFYYFPSPKRNSVDAMESGWTHKLLQKINDWVFNSRKTIYGVTIVLCILGVIGALRLKAVGFIVDDLPKNGKLYTDMKFFEKEFGGVMPLEIVVDAQRKNGATSLQMMEKIDEFNEYLNQYPELGRKLSFVNAVKFARQAYYDGDSSSYGLPNMFDGAFIAPYLKGNGLSGGANNGAASSLMNSFLDSNKQKVRLSISMADVGSVRLPQLLDSITPKAYEIFDTSKNKVSITGTSVTFLEGSKFIISSLKESLIFAFLMIFGCMIFLFRDWRIVLISILVNLVPLIITAGIMGFVGVAIKPSTVLVFSVALGITVDVTIRFLVSYKHDLKEAGKDVATAVRHTIFETGTSILFTSLILIAGFCVFLISDFDGTRALGYLTSLTLLLSMIFNLTLQPAMLLWLFKKNKKTNEKK